MNTEQLETFLALAETKNFSRCAQRLIISQSAVSKRIFELEKELGQTLFHRSGGVALTGEGRAFRPYAEQMLNLREQAAERLNGVPNMHRIFSSAVPTPITTCALAHR